MIFLTLHFVKLLAVTNFDTVRQKIEFIYTSNRINYDKFESNEGHGLPSGRAIGCAGYKGLVSEFLL
jgi:hypothetical protein